MTKFEKATWEYLNLRHPKDQSLMGAVSLTLSIFYEQSMWELTGSFNEAANRYLDYILPEEMNFYCNNKEWRPYKPKSLSRLLNRFATKNEPGYWLEFSQLALAQTTDDDDVGPYPFDEVGRYGLAINGRNHHRGGPFEKSGVSAIHFNFPVDRLEHDGAAKLLKFAAEMAAVAPFDSGQTGFVFTHNPRTSHQLEYEWISDWAHRFIAIHPKINSFEYYCRHHVANIGWLTLLGANLSDQLGGRDAMRAKLSDAVTIRPLTYGTMLIAGDSPPIGDVNLRAPDIGPLREVARLTRPLWIDDATVSNNVLNSIWHEPEERERWINRFELPF